MEVSDQGADVARAVLLAALPAALPHIVDVPDQPPCHAVTWYLQTKLYEKSVHNILFSPHLLSPAGQSKYRASFTE